MQDNPQPASARILVVDDEDVILVALRETLRHESYTVVTETDPNRALERLRESPFAAILSDQRMLHMSGLEFFAEAKLLRPNASRVLLTGVLTLDTVIEAINRGEIYRFIAKPWIREELLATVRNAVQRHELIERTERLQAATARLNDDLSSANRQLQEKISELTTQKRDLDQAQAVLRENLNHSLDLCEHIIGTFHPLLGRETHAVVDICERFCESFTFSEEEKQVLRVAARLHNLGLIGISRDVVLKSQRSPDSLTRSERGLIESHPVLGQILVGFIGDLREVGVAVRSHHERWDGKGYPDGLKGEAIPRVSRYLAVAASYVESGRSPAEALEEIVELSGTHFDPDTVRDFLAIQRLQKLPSKIREISLRDLQPGMVLARPVHGPTGLLLAPEGHRLSEGSLQKLSFFQEAHPLQEKLLVYN